MVTPSLRIRGSAAAMEFYREAFHATEVMRMEGPNGVIVVADIPLGGRPVVTPGQWASLSAPEVERPSTISLEVEDPDSVLKAAAAAGAKVVPDKACIKDPFGQVWHVEARDHRGT